MSRASKRIPFLKRVLAIALPMFLIGMLSPDCESQESHELYLALELPYFDDLTLDPQAVIDICSKALADKKTPNPEMLGKLLLTRARALGRLKKYQDAL